MLIVANLSKQYRAPRGALTVLSGVSFSLAPGDAVAIMGPSGSGKSSLLYVLGALEPPTSGTVTLDGQDPFQLPAAALADGLYELWKDRARADALGARGFDGVRAHYMIAHAADRQLQVYESLAAQPATLTSR